VQHDDVGWWELIPPLPEQDFNMVVGAGDVMQATVWHNSVGSWSTRVDDLTRGVSGLMITGNGYGTILDSDPTVWLDYQGSTTTLSYAGGYSAEWIVEDYGSGNSEVPFANFGTVAFTNLTTSLPSWSLTPAEELGLSDAYGFLLAAPSGADSTGDGFSVTYTG
jgi:hypothetical protein